MQLTLSLVAFFLQCPAAFDDGLLECVRSLVRWAAISDDYDQDRPLERFASRKHVEHELLEYSLPQLSANRRPTVRFEFEGVVDLVLVQAVIRTCARRVLVDETEMHALTIRDKPRGDATHAGDQPSEQLLTAGAVDGVDCPHRSTVISKRVS